MRCYCCHPLLSDFHGRCCSFVVATVAANIAVVVGFNVLDRGIVLLVIVVCMCVAVLLLSFSLLLLSF